MKNDKKNPYEDIIDLEYPFPSRFPRMPVSERAAQFSPFAALTGYGALIREASRYTDERVTPDEHLADDLDRKLRFICSHIQLQPDTEILYFLPDSKKEGGSYETVCSRVLAYDPNRQTLTLADGSRIPIDSILSISCSLYEMDAAGEAP